MHGPQRLLRSKASISHGPIAGLKTVLKPLIFLTQTVPAVGTAQESLYLMITVIMIIIIKSFSVCGAAGCLTFQIPFTSIFLRHQFQVCLIIAMMSFSNEKKSLIAPLYD